MRRKTEPAAKRATQLVRSFLHDHILACESINSLRLLQMTKSNSIREMNIKSLPATFPIPAKAARDPSHPSHRKEARCALISTAQGEAVDVSLPFSVSPMMEVVRLDWPHATSSEGARPYQLGMTSDLSPSMMPSSESENCGYTTYGGGTPWSMN